MARELIDSMSKSVRKASVDVEQDAVEGEMEVEVKNEART